MSRCPTFTFQLAKVPKTLAKHISTNVSYKIILATDMFTLTYFCVEYENNISSWHTLNNSRTKVIYMPLF